jgi:hypothetical protein
MTSTIQDYALIGDGRSCALVARTGSIDFLCWPRLDSDACFAAMLGDERHGHWRISSAGNVTQTRRGYSEDTAILESEHVTDTGRVRVTDLMPWHDGPSLIIRMVEGLDGEAPMAMSLRLRFGYGRIKPWTQRHERGLVFEAGPDRLVLDCPVDLTVDAEGAGARFPVAKGAKIVFVLTYSPSTAPPPSPLKADALVEQTRKEWKAWADRFTAKCRWDGAVRRSLILLRMLTDRNSGGIVAAATLGLPEIPGGSANWDYRYCWLRDSTFTMTALLNAGFHQEARRWRDWILRAVAGSPAEMHIVYRTDGGRRLDEYELHGLPGYQGAIPVRVGNAACRQTQIDVFGEVMDSFDVLAKAGIERTARVVEVETTIVEHLERVWDQPSADIWESRGDPQCYTYSQAMAWVGVSRWPDAGPRADLRRHGAARFRDDVRRRRLSDPQRLSFVLLRPRAAARASRLLRMPVDPRDDDPGDDVRARCARQDQHPAARPVLAFPRYRLGRDLLGRLSPGTDPVRRRGRKHARSHPVLKGLALAVVGAALALRYWPTQETDPMDRRVDRNDGKRGEVLSYAVGYGLALALTCAAFAIVRWPIFAAATTLAVVLGLALVQVGLSLFPARQCAQIGARRSSARPVFDADRRSDGRERWSFCSICERG